jgi:hypothetical protein
MWSCACRRGAMGSRRREWGVRERLPSRKLITSRRGYVRRFRPAARTKRKL